MKYRVCYDNEQLAYLDIDEPKAMPHIQEMVQFWYEWQKVLKQYKGDYIKAWLYYLCIFIWNNEYMPSSNDEGWDDLNEKIGITVVNWDSYPMDKDLIQVSKVT